MIVLDTTTKKLEVGLAGAVAANECHVTVVFYDVPAQAKADASEYRRAVSLAKTAGATPVTICAAPTRDGVVRCVEYICVQNADTSAATVTVRIDDGGTDYNQYAQSVASNKSLVYQDGAGWLVI